MTAVKEMVFTEYEAEGKPAIVIGGDTAFLDNWPSNPKGEKLLLLMTIFFRKNNIFSEKKCFPTDGVFHVFSTYSRTEYFLENIVYENNSVESVKFTSGYTKVVAGDLSKITKSTEECIPRRLCEVLQAEVLEGSFPTFSFFSDSFPEALKEFPEKDEFEFVCQLCSADFPSPFEDVLYLTDGIGYVLYRPNASGSEVGEFFVIAS